MLFDSSEPLGPYLLNCDSYKSLMSPHSMEGTIPTGPYHLDCDSHRSQISHSLRSKRFRLVSEQRKTSVLAAREMEREPKNEREKEGGGGEKTPATPSLLFYSRHIFFARSLTLVPGSLLRNRTETIATQDRSPNSHRLCSNLCNPRFRQAFVGKMLIPKPLKFIVVEISDLDRILLDIIKLCLR